MDWFAPKFRRDPNEKVDSLYAGVAPGGRTVTTVIKKSRTEDAMEATRSYGPGLARGQGGKVVDLILGGMETSLDEVEYLLEGIREKRFVPRRKPGDIAAMCDLLAERHNAQVMHLRKNPSERPKKRTARLYLPVGYHMVPTREPGARILQRS